MITGKVNGKDVYYSENTKQWQYKGNNKPVKTEEPITTVESTECRYDNNCIECDGTTDCIEEDVEEPCNCVGCCGMPEDGYEEKTTLLGKIKRFFKL